MESLRNRKYQKAAALGLAASLLVSAQVARSSEPRPAAAPQRTISFDQAPRYTEVVSRSLRREAAELAIAGALIDRNAPMPPLPVEAKPARQVVKAEPVQYQHSASGIGGFWFGGQSTYDGLLYKASQGAYPHPEVIPNAELFYTMAKARGFTDYEIGLGDNLIYGESGFYTGARNPSGATGLAQAEPGSKMSPFGPDWQHNPVTQLNFFFDYVGGTNHDNNYGHYPSIEAAAAFHQANNWY